MLVFIEAGFLKVVLFVGLWLILDKIWDLATSAILAGVGYVCEADAQALEFEFEFMGSVPWWAVVITVVDTLGTLAVPWAVAGYLLSWL